RGKAVAADLGFDGAIGSGGLQSSVHSEARLLAQFSAAADAERHSAGTRSRQGIARALAWAGSGRRGLRRCGRGRAAGYGLCFDAHAARKMGGGGSENDIQITTPSRSEFQG